MECGTTMPDGKPPILGDTMPMERLAWGRLVILVSGSCWGSSWP